MKLPAIYPITNVELSGLSHTEQVEQLISAGARFIQLREKKRSPRDFIEDARRAVAAARKHDCRIIINDRVDIAIAVNADGVHLGQDDIPPTAARQLLGNSAVIGYSTHSVEQACQATKLPIDYIGVGPAFPTGTKENPDDVIGPVGIRAIRTAVGTFPIVAIGGIDTSNIRSVIRSGADSAAVISALFQNERSIFENYSALHNNVQQS